MIDNKMIELSKLLNIIKEIDLEYSYSNICKMTDDNLEEYKKLLEELKELNENSDQYPDSLRGKKLEELVSFLLRMSGNIFEVMQNIRTSTNEIDQVIGLSNSGKILKTCGLINDRLTLFLGECKNYNKKVSVTYVGKFCSLLLTTNIKLGIVFSFHGVSGSGWNNSQGLIKKFYLSKENENERFCIIDFSFEDFVSIAEGNNLLQILDDKLMALRIDTSYTKMLSTHSAEIEVLEFLSKRQY